jgi:hypothetical protein
MTTNFLLPLSFVAVFGSGIRNPGWVKIRIRDKHPGSATLQKLKDSYPEHCEEEISPDGRYPKKSYRVLIILHSRSGLASMKNQ